MSLNVLSELRSKSDVHRGYAKFFYSYSEAYIILVWMTLHNFIRDTKLHDKEFGRCDVDEEYLPKAPCATAQTHGDESL